MHKYPRSKLARGEKFFWLIVFPGCLTLMVFDVVLVTWTFFFIAGNKGP
jgi:hypothetical protein